MSFDFLPGTTIEIKQRNDMFKINSDTHFLGKFINIKQDDSVLDIGCNNGALLLYASEYHPKRLVGVDCFLEAIELAKENMEHNHVCAELICSKIQDFHDEVFDVIICNPPFFKTSDNTLSNKNTFRHVARHEELLTLQELFLSVKRLLASNGRFFLVHRTHRLVEIIDETSTYGLKIKRMKLVYDENKEYSTSTLFEIVRGKNDQVLVEKPIFLKR